MYYHALCVLGKNQTEVRGIIGRFLRRTAAVVPERDKGAIDTCVHGDDCVVGYTPRVVQWGLYGAGSV